LAGKGELDLLSKVTVIQYVHSPVVLMASVLIMGARSYGRLKLSAVRGKFDKCRE
jgi:hypothetical protein